jgi:hypothetical protein
MDQLGDIRGRILAAPKAINDQNPCPSCKAQAEPNSPLTS